MLLYNRKQSADYDEVTADVLVAFLQFPINILCLHSVYVPHFLQFSSTPADLPIGITIIVVTLKGEICGRGDLRSHGSVTLGHHWGTGLGFTQLEPFTEANFVENKRRSRTKIADLLKRFPAVACYRPFYSTVGALSIPPLRYFHPVHPTREGRVLLPGEGGKPADVFLPLIAPWLVRHPSQTVLSCYRVIQQDCDL